MTHSYCRDVSVKTRTALRSKRVNGDYIGSCPIYGYKRSEDNRNRLVVDEYPAGIVREIFRMKLDGRSALKIAESLNARGVLSPIEYKKNYGFPHPKYGYAYKEDAKWSPTTIIRILKDSTYTGALVQGKCSTPNYKLKERIAKPEDEWMRTEKAHEAIISPKDFDLVQKVSRLDTRTAPHSEAVYIFSGVLICGCCGNRMTRKTVPYKGKSYYYYYCPTGKRGGCKASGMVKENDLRECVLESVRSHIANVASLEVLLAKLDAEYVGHELARTLESQMEENFRQLEKINKFKSGLYERMMEDFISHEQFKSLKEKYAGDEAAIMRANEKLQREIEEVSSCRHERMAWTEHFTQFSNLQELDRKTVTRLIHSVKIIRKTEIEITFNYQFEYEKALAMLRKEAS